MRKRFFSEQNSEKIIDKSIGSMAVEILNAYLYLMITEQKHGRSSIKTSLSQHLLHIFSPVSERISFGDFNLEELVI